MLGDCLRYGMNMRNKIISLAALLAVDVAWADITWYVVDPMSETRFMPHEAPQGGEKGGAVRLVAARGEYEPASFVLVSDSDLEKVSCEFSDLTMPDGTVFPKECLDLRIVKVWYQSGTAWFSYFQDAKMKLCPELLLHDEDLVKVDEEKGWNYARITEEDGRVWYRWLNPPRSVDSRVEDVGDTGHPYFVRDSFSSMKPNFRDADSFVGVSLPRGVFKQLWITAKIDKDAKPGRYSGEVKIESKAGGGHWRIPIALRVLDFELPEPCTYFDCHRRFFTRFRPYLSLNHIVGANGNDRELAKRQMVAVLRNFAEHGCRLPSYLDRYDHPEWGREAGLDFTHPLYEAGAMRLGEKVAMRYHARRVRENLTKSIGWHNPILEWGDEYGLSTLIGIRDMVRIYSGEGFKFMTNSQAGYEGGSYMADVWRPPFTPDNRNFETAFRVSRLDGCELGWYANQHVGVENPAFCRRQYGYGPYRAGFTFDGNYALNIQGWNDLAGFPYRPMMTVYGVYNGCLDTIAWEGFREGVDDIRYATLLQRLAHGLTKSDKLDARYEAKKSLGLLANADKDDMDLTTLRLEMIEHILKMKEFGEER